MTAESDLQHALSLLRSGQAKAAFKQSKAAMRTYGGAAVFPNLAGMALCTMGKHRDGIDYFQKALKIDPGFVDARRNLAQTLILLGKSDLACTVLERLVRDVPEDADGWYLLAQAQMKRGGTDAAETAVTRSIELNARQARAFNLRALIRDRAGRMAEALDDYQTALRLNPDDVDTLTNISLPLARQGRTAEAMDSVRRAVALAPGHVGARLRLAAQLVEMGETAEAITELHAVLERAPDQADAIEQLAQLQSADENAALLPQARAELKKLHGKSPARASLNFALARIADQAGERESAARYLAEANRTMAELMPYDPTADSALHDRIMARFKSVTGAAASGAEEAPMPIFVVGLPRSGTTLVEAILGAHPNVQPLGERAAAGILLGPIIEADGPFGADQIAAFVAGDLSMLPDLSEGTTAYVDKMPENYRLIGFLKTAYPTCRVINLRRDPRDVALSNWRAHFSGSALSYAYDLAGMAHHFNRYARIMTHWHRVFPDQILDLKYEELVADVEAASKALAAHCGLDWVPAMARPDLTAEQVLTLSATQLRQPVHSRSVGGWRKHADTLAPFVQGLDPALWPDLA